MTEKEKWLIFVDTNILLDFYRLRGASATKYLEAMERNKHRLIVTEQVEMEYLKHRQRVAQDALSEVKKPSAQRFPPFLEDSQASQTMKKSLEEAVAQHKKIAQRVSKIVSNPGAHDQVYKSLNRIFEYNGPYVLGRKTQEKNRIRSLARKRFSLGYPPRKSNDVSIGDPLNWEWIVHCAQKCPEKSNIVIVSRDGDYGVVDDGRHLRNDWLRKEFQERVSRRRKIELTDLLTHALKKLDVPVTRAEVEEERIISVETSALPKVNSSGEPTASWADFSKRIGKAFAISDAARSARNIRNSEASMNEFFFRLNAIKESDAFGSDVDKRIDLLRQILSSKEQRSDETD